jgi:hypothetical protein
MAEHQIKKIYQKVVKFYPPSGKFSDVSKLARDPKLLGQLLESFVGLELLRHLSWSQTRAQLYTFAVRVVRKYICS